MSCGRERGLTLPLTTPPLLSLINKWRYCFLREKIPIGIKRVRTEPLGKLVLLVRPSEKGRKRSPSLSKTLLTSFILANSCPPSSISHSIIRVSILDLRSSGVRRAIWMSARWSPVPKFQNRIRKNSHFKSGLKFLIYISNQPAARMWVFRTCSSIFLKTPSCPFLFIPPTYHLLSIPPAVSFI